MSDPKDRDDAAGVEVEAVDAGSVAPETATAVAPVAPAERAEARPIEHWRDRLGVKPWKHEGARVLAKWGAGQVVSEAEYNDAVERFEKHSVGRE